MTNQNPNQACFTDQAARRRRDSSAGAPCDGLPIHDHPLRPLTDLPLESIIARLAARCRRNLSRFPGIDAEDATQETLVQIFKYSFLKNYDPRKGDIWGYLYGVADRVCYRSIRDWKRHLQACSSCEIAGRILSARTPEEAAGLREILQDIRSVSEALSPGEQAALPDILDRTHGSRYHRDRTHRPNYAATCRCRRKLRMLLARHDPNA